jgi:hypothetical protein
MFESYNFPEGSTSGSQYDGSRVSKWCDAIAIGRPNTNACQLQEVK